jgi:hypothetical protein
MFYDHFAVLGLPGCEEPAIIGTTPQQGKEESLFVSTPGRERL